MERVDIACSSRPLVNEIWLHLSNLNFTPAKMLLAYSVMKTPQSNELLCLGTCNEG
mgnify:CR=1 FL=1